MLQGTWKGVRRKKPELKNEMRYSQQAESSAIRFPINRRSFLQDGSHACTRNGYQICIPVINWRSVYLRSALELFSHFSHSCECGAVRFLLWWLFLHRRLRSSNEAQLALSHFCTPSAGPLQRVSTRFYPSGSRKSRNLL